MAGWVRSRGPGPFTAAIILIASIGSAMAAELGTMKVSEEIDALQVMSVSPEDFLATVQKHRITFVSLVPTHYIMILSLVNKNLCNTAPF